MGGVCVLIWAAATAAERQGCACEGALLMELLMFAIGIASFLGVCWVVVWDDRRRQRGGGK